MKTLTQIGRSSKVKTEKISNKLYCYINANGK